jgi:hypothetical protein
MADPSRGSKARLALDDGAHQLVGVKASLHQRFRLAFADELDRFRGGRLAVRRVDNWRAAQIEVELLRDRLDARARTDEDRRDQAELRGVERTP